MELINWTADYFKKNGIESARLDAELLLGHILNKNRLQLYLDFEQVIAKEYLAQYRELIKKRVERVPVAYLTNHKEFMSLSFYVDESVLIPRPETEVLVETVLKLRSDACPPACGGGEGGCKVLDLGTGSGAIVIALATWFTSPLPSPVRKSEVGSGKSEGKKLSPFLPPSAFRLSPSSGGCGVRGLLNPSSQHAEWKFVATDISTEALVVAKKNAQRHEVAERITFLQGDLFEPLQVEHSGEDGDESMKFDCIVSNPPYISSGEIPALMPEVRDYEPRIAIDGGSTGLDFIDRLVAESPKFLTENGRLVFEFGYQQGDAVRNLVQSNPQYTDCSIIKDYAGIERVVVARVGSL